MQAGLFGRLVAAPARSLRLSHAGAAVTLAGVTALACAVRFASFGRVPGNPYYDAAVRSMGLSWHNLFYGAFEPGGQVAIDKPPADLWLQVASVKLLGFSSIALRMPEAVAGALAVPLLYDLVRRLFGRGAGLAAALSLALMPVAVLDARSDTMDALMMVLLVAAGWLAVFGAQRRRGWPVLAAGAVLGVAFNVKLFECLIALPALAALALLAADLPLRRRLLHLAGAAATFTLVALSWVAVASLAPLSSRPYPIGSTNGSVWNVTFAYNGLDRLRGSPATGVASFDPAGPLRLFSSGGRDFGALIGVLLVPALVLGALALLERRRRRGPAPARLQRAGAVFVIVWLATGVVLFSAVGRMQIRYLEAMTPAVAAAVGVGFAWLVSAARSRPAAALSLAGGACLTALAGSLIARGPGWAAGVALGGALTALVSALAAAHPRSASARRVLIGVLACGSAAAILAVPLAQTLKITGSAQTSAQRAGRLPPSKLEPLSAYLRGHQGGARYEVASANVARAASLIVRDARPVLMLTSLQGRPLITARQLAAAVAAGSVRDLLMARGTCGRGSHCPAVLRWAHAHATYVGPAHGLRITSLARLTVAPAAPAGRSDSRSALAPPAGPVTPAR